VRTLWEIATERALRWRIRHMWRKSHRVSQTLKFAIRITVPWVASCAKAGHTAATFELGALRCWNLGCLLAFLCAALVAGTVPGSGGSIWHWKTAVPEG